MRSEFLQNREKPNFKLFVIFKSPELFKGPILTAIGYTVWWRYSCHSSLLKKKTKTNQNKTRNENECEKNRARGKTRQKKDKLNIELFVMLNLRISKSTNFDSSRLQQSSDASKIITLFVTRWLPALTISYLIGSFEIMMMPKDIFLFGTIMANLFNISFNLRIKSKGDLRIQRCH